MPKGLDITDSANVAGPVSEEKIRAAEEELEVVFPEEYSNFLKKYGAAVIDVPLGVYEIAGVFDWDEMAPPMWNHVVYSTKK